MKPTRITANLVGMMLFVQVTLGGGSVVLHWDVNYHIAWGAVTFVVLIAATVLAARDYSRQSNILGMVDSDRSNAEVKESRSPRPGAPLNRTSYSECWVLLPHLDNRASRA